jgi:hypothetical protein
VTVVDRAGWPLPDATLFEHAAAERLAAVMAELEEHTDPTWATNARLFLAEYLRTHPTMHVDDLWEAGLEPPEEMRALGAVIQWAARRELMTKTSERRPSVRSHLAEKPVWASLVYEPAAA